MKPASIFALTLLAAVPALAQPYSTSWVSHSGADTLSCGLTANPCRTFQQAYSHTSNNGVVKAMDAGEYSPINIAKPITIDGNGVGASIDATGHTGVLISGTAGPVEIRSLAINGSAAGAPYYGITTQNSSNVVIEDVSITGNITVGVGVTGGTAAIHGLTVTGAANGVLVEDGTLTISDSVVRNSNTAIDVQGINAIAQVLIERSKVISNSLGLFVNNAGFAATARLSDDVITANTTGTATNNGGQIITLRNNTWAGNSTDGSTPFSISLK
jgi:hypothetical protein